MHALHTAGLRNKQFRFLDGYSDSWSNRQSRDGWHRDWGRSTMLLLFFWDADGGCVCVSACLSSALTLFRFRLVSRHHGWGVRLPWQHHFGSTRSVQPVFLLFLSADWLTPPNNVFKAVFFSFFTVWCLFSVPVAHAAVNRLIESCCFFQSTYFCVLVCIVSTRCCCVLSHRRMCLGCEFCIIAIGEINVRN